ncbi:hypothetical protein NON00_15225 [Roseomonas sp. GC11]|uniref:hypothetical protein n=1 Tax=Roseomonas sp. GC11 TaxID=2950546 RepID=UPI00210F1EB1|nr:hypothetical protein [Roseomonas sp. GC11]MCQ4161271.1 hypothetical protein [Roseomonas sp. GC11]
MAQLRIEFDRQDGQGWRVRSEGQFPGTAEQVKAALPRYALQYPHRAFLDGVLVAEAASQIGVYPSCDGGG